MMLLPEPISAKDFTVIRQLDEVVAVVEFANGAVRLVDIEDVAEYGEAMPLSAVMFFKEDLTSEEKADRAVKAFYGAA